VFGKGEEMAFNFSSSIPVSRQREELNVLMSEVMVLLYRGALSFGVDPETLTEDWEPGEELSDIDTSSLARDLAKYSLIKSKLDGLPS